MNHEDQIKDYERRLQGISDAIVEKDGEASKLRMEITSPRLTNQRLEAEIFRLRHVHRDACDQILQKMKELDKATAKTKRLEATVDSLRGIISDVENSHRSSLFQSRLRDLESRGEQKGEK